MAYLNVDLDYPTHPKTLRLSGILGPGAEVYPLRLWSHTGKYHAEDGRLDGYTIQEISACCGWTGDSDTFISAMVRVAFLEGVEGAYRVHAWLEHQGHIVAFKERSRKANKARWSKIKGESSNKESLEESSKDSGMESPLPTIPTVPSLPSIPTMPFSHYTELSVILTTIPGYPFKANIDIPLLKEKERDYPEIDTVSLLKGWKIYLVDNPLKKKSNPRSQLNNQFEFARKYGKYKKPEAPISCPSNNNGLLDQRKAEAEKWKAAQ